MSKRSKTCFSKKTEKPLAEYSTALEAREAAADINANAEGGIKMVEYQCKKCERWHLSPADRHTPSEHCHSCDKQLYATEQGAKRRAEIRHEEEGIWLEVYRCDKGGDGWHLTKS